MKKIILLLLVLILIPSGANISAQKYDVSIDDESIQIKKTLSPNSVEILKVKIHKIDDSDYIRLRDLAEKFDAEIEWDEKVKSISIYKDGLKILFKANNKNIIINSEEFSMELPVVIKNGTSYAPPNVYKLFLTSTKIEDTSITEKKSDEQNETIVVETLKKADKITLDTTYESIERCFILSNPERLVLDIHNFKIPDQKPTGSTFLDIRHFVAANGITRLVFDLNDEYKYSIINNDVSVDILISKDGKLPQTASNIEYKQDKVILKTNNYEGYIISRSSNPFSVNVWIPDQIANTKTVMKVDGEFIKSITSQAQNGGSYIEIETAEQCVFELEKKSNEFIVKISEPIVKNLEYFNNDGKYIQVLEDMKDMGTGIKDMGTGIKVMGTGINDVLGTLYSNSNKSVKIEINDPQGKLTEGQVYINDGFIKNIFVKRSGKKATIEIEADKALLINKIAKDNSVIFYINHLKYKNMLVAISAGHGGKDPGAVRGSIHESHLNLSIAKKLEELLAKEGISSYMIRTDDTYISLDNRVNIANKLEPDLFISIHCNAFHNPDYDGIMTLVHNGKVDYNNINGRTAGELIHEKLLETTGAVDRGVRFRDKIVVLRKTSMPAVEIEAGFLTNEDELVKLLDDSYQWRIALGTMQGIKSVLDMILK